MFTGIVEELGQIKRVTSKAGIVTLEVSAKKALLDTRLGDSIAINGVCLTVVNLGLDSVSFEVMRITYNNTNLELLKINDLVNLERSLRLGDRVSGHFVSGHIDCLGLVRNKFMRYGNLELAVAVAPSFIKYCFLKGSISLDGVSLTIANKRGNVIGVCIIPHTFKNTTLSFKGPAHKLNVEFDILAKKSPV